ncbi:unnamed protein product [Chrysodeixis includens]|uniref:Uncharacterized protein n=1 Tax=Chrysodeixis includens TaxID=689277 RepID=A0A9N8KU04_CHRIL|nr:unnamed protein product [Chrysodeixis includens]
MLRLPAIDKTVTNSIKPALTLLYVISSADRPFITTLACHSSRRDERNPYNQLIDEYPLRDTNARSVVMWDYHVNAPAHAAPPHRAPADVTPHGDDTAPFPFFRLLV